MLSMQHTQRYVGKCQEVKHYNIWKGMRIRSFLIREIFISIQDVYTYIKVNLISHSEVKKRKIFKKKN